ncbi:MAG: GNAT family N-acetyltransferase [Myxococcota bacterium]|nr:GNAT family N-acetyltransferase [Myxococcota bacterium]
MTARDPAGSRSAAAELPRHAFRSAAELLTDAFLDNPAHVYLLPDEGRRPPRLLWLLTRNLSVQAELGRSFCVLDERGSVDALGFWHPPGTPSVGLGTLLRHGFGLALFRLGPGALRRLLETVDAIETQRLEAQGDAPAWYLHNMAVRRRSRGSGVGSRLLGTQLAQLVDPTGRPAVLATQRPENVVFYGRLGFEVASERTLGTGPLAFRNWVMVRPGAPTRGAEGRAPDSGRAATRPIGPTAPTDRER